MLAYGQTARGPRSRRKAREEDQGEIGKEELREGPRSPPRSSRSPFCPPVGFWLSGSPSTYPNLSSYP